MLISSQHNARVKRLRALRQREERQRSGLAYAEGLRIVREAAEQGGCLETLVVAPSLLRSRAAWSLVQELEAAGTEILEVTPAVFAQLSTRDGPQGLAAVVRQRWTALAEADPAFGWWVALDAVQDPGNLGTILRTCDAAGASGVILIGACADPYHPVALRAGMGATFAQRLVRVERPEFCAWTRRTGVAVVGAAPDASQDYRAIDYPLPLVLLLGNEQRGLCADLLAMCSVTVSIPMVGRADSLNLAVATSLLLYEVVRRQRPAR